MVTQPLEKPVSETPMAKVTTTQASTTDTLITLKKSGKVLMLPKGLSAKQIDKLDKFLSQNKTPAATASIIQPNAEMCGWHTTYGWEYEYQYEPANGKALGIWIQYDYLNQSQLYNLGFREIAISDATSRDAAFNGGFQYQDMMLLITNQGTSQEQMNSVNSAQIHINKCYIDEPYESISKSGHVVWSESDIFTFASFLQSNYPTTELFLTSYTLPYYDMEYTVSALSTAYVMCDQYYGGTVNTWNYDKADYGNKNISNWMSLEYNHSGTGYPDFSTLYGAANRLGINDIWLFADNYGNADLVHQFCDAAWSNGWLTKLRKQIIITWKCNDPNPCQNCIWGSPNSNWIINGITYTGDEEYVP